jgi:hypothetical protein
MADVKKGSDLITTMGETEKRIKKLERQLAVPRKGASSVVTEESTTSSPTINYSGETVTVVPTANCLVHFFLQLDAKQSSGRGAVYLQDVTANNYVYLIIVDDTVYRTYSSAPGSNPDPTVFTYHNGPDWQIGTTGGAITVPYTTAGSRTFRLGYACIDAVGTFTVKNRNLFAWVQPF